MCLHADENAKAASRCAMRCVRITHFTIYCADAHNDAVAKFVTTPAAARWDQDLCFLARYVAANVTNNPPAIRHSGRYSV